MNKWLIAISEIERNVSLPAIAIVGAAIAFWQARIGRRKNGFDLISKAAELRASAHLDTRLMAYALLIEAARNPASRKMATSAAWDYTWREDDGETLRRILRLAHGTSFTMWVQWCLDVVMAKSVGENDDG